MSEPNENQEILWNVLLQIKEIFDAVGCPFFLIGGTLLGFVRDGKIIPWDKDLDIGVFEGYEPLIERAIELAKRKGWSVADWGFGRMLGNRGRLIAFYKPEYKRSEQVNHLDVFMFYKHENIFWYGCGGGHDGYHQIAIFSKEYLTNLSTITVKDVTFNIPNPSELYLEYQYGKNWRTPISNEAYEFEAQNDIYIRPHFDKNAFYAKQIKDSWIRKIAVVTEFEQKDFFQWFIALKKYEKELKIEITPVIASSSHQKNYDLTDPHWYPIRSAEFVFVYATRMERGLEWWTLPQFVKQLMHPKAKMIAQYDDEFMWLFHPETTWWDYPNPPNKGPEQFFRDTGILEVPQAHLCVMKTPLFKQYTKKPVHQLILPQLNRYNLEKYSPTHKLNNIALLIHSPQQASIQNSIDNVVKAKNYPVTIFTNKVNTLGINYCVENKLPIGSRAFGFIPRESFVDLLWQFSSIALDDNTNYIGWSRFVMECAIAYIPCVGSSDAVKELFPALHTAPNDYARQIFLIERLRTEPEFYANMARIGHERCLEFFNEKRLCQELLKIFESVDNWWSK